MAEDHKKRVWQEDDPDYSFRKCNPYSYHVIEPVMTPEEREAWLEKGRKAQAERNRLWESLPGKTLSGIKSEDGLMHLYFSDGVTLFITGEDIDHWVEEPTKPRNLKPGEDEALAKLFSHTEEL
jgi:hypothetical protein